jgi:lysophospholipase L1-like esterase
MIPSLHIVGDSISIQYGPYLEKMLAGVLTYTRKTGNVGNLDNPEGANGGDSSMVLNYLQTLRNDARVPFDYLMVNCGLHDLRVLRAQNRYQIPIEQYAANLTAIIKVAKSLARNMIWVRTTTVVDEIHNREHMEFFRYARDVDRYNACADDIVRAHRIPMIDLFTFTRTLGDEVYFDHVHFKEIIREQHAAFIAGYLYSMISRKE